MRSIVHHHRAENVFQTLGRGVVVTAGRLCGPGPFPTLAAGGGTWPARGRSCGPFPTPAGGGAGSALSVAALGPHGAVHFLLLLGLGPDSPW